MAAIHHQIGVKVSIEDAYQAITSLEGLSSWWTKATGGTGTGDILCFHFGEHTVEMQIEVLEKDKVVWRCIAEEGEWKDTHINFDLALAYDQVFINFSHTDWAEQTDFCAHCSMKWAVFMLSLKDYLEKGKGHPFPDDIHINHIDF
jgi:uncharacterized protein YndB with AHSA1/START domain